MFKRKCFLIFAITIALLFWNSFSSGWTNSLDFEERVVNRQKDLKFPEKFIHNIKDLEESVSDGQIDSTFPIKFYQNAYIDFRYPIPKLRLFSVNGCIRTENFLLVDINYNGTITTIKLFGDSLEGTCPSVHRPGRPCFYSPHAFAGELRIEGLDSKQFFDSVSVFVRLGARKVKLAVKEVVRKREPGLTICVQTVFYYTQWQNIVLYVEAWRAQGATRFIVFFHSANKDTKKVLDYYQEKGLIELSPWPSYGSLPAEIAGKYPEIDDSVFIFSQFLSTNICVVEVKTSLGSVVDFDEVIVPSSGSVLDYALREMTGTDVGALSFENNYVTMEPSIYTSNFSGVASPVFIEKSGPPKYIFNASVIEIAQIHWVRSFIKEKRTKSGDGALLHYRFDAVKYTDPKKEKPHRFFPNNVELHIRNMQETASTIFNGSIPKFTFDLITGLTSCVEKKITRRNGCESPGGICREDMDKLTEWVYDQTPNVFVNGNNGS